MQPGYLEEAQDAVAGILSEIQAATYSWDIASDGVTWQPAPPSGLGLSDGAMATGNAWSSLVDPDALTSPKSAILGSTARDAGEGVAYELEYALRVPGRNGMRLVWVEDIGRWFAGEDGRARAARGLLRIVSDRHEAEQRLAVHTRFDAATGTLNRGRLLDVLDATLSDAKRYQTSCALLLLTVENIGAMNELYSHEIADELLVGVARRLRERMRAGDALGRFSNTVFGLVLANCTLPEMTVAAQRFVDCVHDAPIESSAGPIGVRLSGAGVVGPRHGRTRGEMVARAGETLSTVRRQRRGTFAAYQPGLNRDEERAANLKLVEDLVTALNEDRVALVFQPVVAAAETHKPVWHEVLARLLPPDGGAPCSIFPYVQAAEKLGLVHLLDRRVMQLVNPVLTGTIEHPVAVNVSAATMGDPDWRDRVFALVEDEPAIAPRLMVEITETAALANLDEAAAVVAGLRARGVRVAIDDFGAGHTSFRALRGLGVDVVKIDGAFITDLAESSDDRAFVRAMIALAHEIGFMTVAERVENAKVAEILIEMGIDYLQGDLFGAAGPLPGA